MTEDSPSKSLRGMILDSMNDNSGLNRLADKTLWMAPLAGFTDQGFRRLAKDWGADVLVSEMISADGLVRDSKRTVEYIKFTPGERPYGVQLFGSDPLILARAAEFCLSFEPDFIDLNMGCPVKKVIRRGAGSALMRDPERAESMVRAVKRVIDGAVPLSVKFRSGWDSNSLNYLDFGKRLEAAGADFLCLHARTTKQMFSGSADWSHIAALKKVLTVPLIGNGDIVDPESALRMYQETGCDSLMIGRGAMGNPWIFLHTKQFLETGSYGSITRDKLVDAILTQIDYALQHKPEHVVVREMRSQFCHYTKGIIGGAELRRRINHAESRSELREIVEELRHFGGAHSA